jgi:hypothetical protein
LNKIKIIKNESLHSATISIDGQNLEDLLYSLYPEIYEFEYELFSFNYYYKDLQTAQILCTQIDSEKNEHFPLLISPLDDNLPQVWLNIEVEKTETLVLWKRFGTPEKEDTTFNNNHKKTTNWLVPNKSFVFHKPEYEQCIKQLKRHILKNHLQEDLILYFKSIISETKFLNYQIELTLDNENSINIFYNSKTDENINWEFMGTYSIHSFIKKLNIQEEKFTKDETITLVKNALTFLILYPENPNINHHQAENLFIRGKDIDSMVLKPHEMYLNNISDYLKESLKHDILELKIKWAVLKKHCKHFGITKSEAQKIYDQAKIELRSTLIKRAALYLILGLLVGALGVIGLKKMHIIFFTVLFVLLGIGATVSGFLYLKIYISSFFIKQKNLI